MTVEIIQHNPNEVLDLTGGSDAESNQEPEDTKTQEGEEEVAKPAEEHPSTDSNTEEPEAGGSIGDDSSTDADSTDDSPEEPSVEEEGESEFYFGDTRVNVEVPEEIGKALEEAGIDSKSLLSELFAKDSNFELKEETHKALSDKFGATLVNGYLNMYKSMNEKTLADVAAAKEAEEKTFESQKTEYAELVGGEEGLVELESFIVENLDENQIQSYNSIMENGDHQSQMLVISQLKKQKELQDRLANGDKPEPLVSDKGSSTKAANTWDKGYLTAEEYQSIINDRESGYWKDSEMMKQVDAARSAGIKKGI